MKNFCPLLLFVTLLLPGCQGEPSSAPSAPSGSPPAVRAVEELDEARREFRKADLPAIELAEKLVITRVGPQGGPSITIDDTDELREFRNSLVVKDIPPSGGMNWAELEWFKDGKSLRKVWVFSDGEWGVERPGVSPTTGISPALIDRIKQALAASQDPDEAS